MLTNLVPSLNLTYINMQALLCTYVHVYVCCVYARVFACARVRVCVHLYINLFKIYPLFGSTYLHSTDLMFV